MPDDNNAQTPDMTDEIAALRREIERLNGNRFLRIQNSPARLLWYRFLSGLFTGLGTVIGATLLVSLVVYWLQGINWIPVIGDWAAEIASQIEENMSRRATTVPSEPITPLTPDR
jgi:hypothetical protein